MLLERFLKTSEHSQMVLSDDLEAIVGPLGPKMALASRNTKLYVVFFNSFSSAICP